MRRAVIGLLATFVVCAMAVPVMAQPNSPVIAVHLTAHPTKGAGCSNGNPVDGGVSCADFVTAGDLNTSYDAWLVVANGPVSPGVGAISCGILYEDGAVGEATKTNLNKLDVYAWTMCATGLQFPNGPTGLPADEWPASGGGNRITWDTSSDCQTTVIGELGVHGTAGFMYVFAYHEDFFQITPNNNLVGPPELRIADCNNSETELPITAAGNAYFSAGAATQGCTPCTGPGYECQPIPVAATTWGKIKQKY